MPTFTDRVEALITVPASTTVSASTGAHTSAVTVTIDAGDYYLTEAGGVDSLIDTLETELNENVQGYPANASALGSIIGGIWTSGAAWQCQEAATPLVAAFGSPNLTAVSSPTYQQTGPRTGRYSVGFNSTDDAFSGGDVFNVTGTDDLLFAWVGYASAAANADFAGKWNGATGWILANETNKVTLYIDDGPDAAVASTGQLLTGEWYVGLAYIDRTAGFAGVAIKGLTSGTVSSGSASSAALGDITNAANFRLGDVDNYGAASAPLIAYAAISVGASFATGIHAGITTAIANFASAVGSTFSVSLDTSGGSGRVTIANSYLPSYVQFTSTNLRTLLGYEYEFDYPQTNAQLGVALGQTSPQWETGWLCNETSGSLSAAFGGITLTANSTPAYSDLGPRGGADKAVTFNSTDDFFYEAAAINIDVGASDDLALLLVAKFSSVSGNEDIAGKGWAGGTGYLLAREGAAVRLYVDDGPDQVSASVAIAANTWYAILGVLERATNTMRVGVVPLVGSASPTVSTNTSASAVGSLSNASAIRLGDNDAYGAVGMTLAAAYVSSAPGAATGLTSGMSTALSSFATYMKSQTSTQQAKGLWFPDCPLFCDGDPEQAPLVTDRRATISPTKASYALCGNSGYEHTGLVYSHVPRAQVWNSAATYDNGAWETFAKDCIMGLGHEWFTASSPLQFYWNNAGTLTLLGDQGNDGDGMSGWHVVDLNGINPKRSVGEWTGLFRVEIGAVVTDE